MTDRPSNIERAAGRTVEGLDSVFGPASPAAVFSAPERLGDDLVITAASWERAGGFGFGGGGNSQDDGGGGGGGEVEPPWVGRSPSSGWGRKVSRSSRSST